MIRRMRSVLVPLLGLAFGAYGGWCIGDLLFHFFASATTEPLARGLLQLFFGGLSIILACVGLAVGLAFGCALENG